MGKSRANKTQSERPGPASIIYETQEAWEAEGVRRFGPDRLQWRFVCPSCGFEQSVSECLEAGMSGGGLGYSCIGRFRETCQEAFTGGPGPCNYAGGGLFRIAPVSIKEKPDEGPYFDFAPAKGV